MDTCETCKFAHINWRKGDEHTVLVHAGGYQTHETRERVATSVQCRRYAPRGPVVVTENHYETTAFPWLNGDDWCGQYIPKAPS